MIIIMSFLVALVIPSIVRVIRRIPPIASIVHFLGAGQSPPSQSQV